MISIVTPLYNKAATIKRAITSVLNQTFTDFELIVVNDGSSDDSEAVVRQIKDSRIRLVKQNNQGVSIARNRGIKESKNDWIAFLDADDEWRPTFLECLMRIHKKYPQCTVCATIYQRCDNKGSIHDISLNNCPISQDFIMDNYFDVAAYSDPPLHSSSIMVRKSALLSIGGFPEGIHQGEDLLTWARLAATGTIAYCTVPQSIFYIGESHLNGQPKRIPDPTDPVGKGLEELHLQHPEIKGLVAYIALWHKMRASIYLRLPDSSKMCRKEIRQAQRWHFKWLRLLPYSILSYTPYALRMKMLKMLNTR